MANLFKRGKLWYVDYRYNGRRIQRSLGLTTRTAAEVARGQLELTLAQGKSPFTSRCLTLGELFQLYDEYCVSRNRPHTVNTKRTYCKRFLAFFGDAPLTDIGRSDIERFFIKRAKNAGAFTVNRELATLRHALNLAVDRGLLDINPAAKIKLLPEEKRAIKILSDDEFKTYFSWCFENDPLLFDLSIIAFNTGLRRGDILKIKSEDVDEKRRVLTVKVSKRRGELILYLELNDAALEVLARRKKQTKNGFVFPGRDGTCLVEFKRRFARALRETGVSFLFGQFRHNCATALLAAGANLRTVQAILGHSSITTTERYLAVGDEQRREALAGLAAKTVTYTLQNKSSPIRALRDKNKTP